MTPGSTYSLSARVFPARARCGGWDGRCDGRAGLDRMETSMVCGRDGSAGVEKDAKRRPTGHRSERGGRGGARTRGETEAEADRVAAAIDPRALQEKKKKKKPGRRGPVLVLLRTMHPTGRRNREGRPTAGNHVRPAFAIGHTCAEDGRGLGSGRASSVDGREVGEGEEGRGGGREMLTTEKEKKKKKRKEKVRKRKSSNNKTTKSPLSLLLSLSSPARLLPSLCPARVSPMIRPGRSIRTAQLA